MLANKFASCTINCRSFAWCNWQHSDTRAPIDPIAPRVSHWPISTRFGIRRWITLVINRGKRCQVPVEVLHNIVEQLRQVFIDGLENCSDLLHEAGEDLIQFRLKILEGSDKFRWQIIHHWLHWQPQLCRLHLNPLPDRDQVRVGLLVPSNELGLAISGKSASWQGQESIVKSYI